jgi:outer membrane protein OmpA-like peptidoglycan-associated protein
MTRPSIIGLGAVLLLLPALLVSLWLSQAKTRLARAEVEMSEPSGQVAVAMQANEAYCTAGLRKILRRVLQSCGLLHGRAGRGCRPVDAKAVATMSGEDFNALFIPMLGRGGIVQFDLGSADLDPGDRSLVEKVYSKRGGASYFFVVARASTDGPIAVNRELSRKRAEGVMAHLEKAFHDSELESLVGLLWLGEEYAQLDPSFCQWERSGSPQSCLPEELNRSAFITWIDCRL